MRVVLCCMSSIILMQLTVSLGYECGKRMGKFSSRIVGGSDAEEGEFPYQVSVDVVFFGIVDHFCGGSLISDQWVITGAQCLFGEPVAIHLGQHSLSSPSVHEKVVGVEKYIAHPDFLQYNFTYDVALIKMDEKVVLTDYIQPICLPDGIKHPPPKLVATGWGALYNGSKDLSDILQKVTLDVISNEECKSKGSYYATEIYPHTLCTLTPGKDACHADGGGPLADLSGPTAYLIGMSSWGIGCGSPEWPGVWTNLLDPEILKWVKETAGLNHKKILVTQIVN